MIPRFAVPHFTKIQPAATLGPTDGERERKIGVRAPLANRGGGAAAAAAEPFSSLSLAIWACRRRRSGYNHRDHADIEDDNCPLHRELVYSLSYFQP